jgi:hypothetical protein
MDKKLIEELKEMSDLAISELESGADRVHHHFKNGVWRASVSVWRD